MVEAAQQTRPTEAESSPEQRAVKADTREVTSSLFAQKVPENPTAEDARRIDADPAAQAIFTAQYCARVDERTIREKGGIPLREGMSAKVMGTEGGEGRLVEITGVDGDNLKCKYEVGEGDSTAMFEESFTRGEIQNSILVSEKDAIVNGFSGEQQQVVKAQLDTLDPSVKPEDINQPDAETLRKAAESLNLASAEHAQTLIETMTPSEQNSPQVQAIKKRLEARIFADPKDFSDISHIISPDIYSLDDRIGAISEDRIKMEVEASGLADDDPKKKELQGKIADAQKQEAAFNLAQQVLQQEETELTPTGGEALALLEADAIIGDRMKVLTTQIEEAVKVDLTKLSHEDRKLQEHKNNNLQFQLGHLQLATLANGTAGIHMKHAALKVMQDQAGVFAGTRLNDVVSQLQPQAERASAEMQYLIQKSGLPQEKITEFQKVLTESGGDIIKAMQDPEFAKIKGISEALFGMDLSLIDAGQVDQAITNIIEGANLSKAQIDKLKLAKGAGLGGLLALLILLGITGGAMAFVGKGVAGANNRQ